MLCLYPLDPVALQLASLKVHGYGLMYLPALPMPGRWRQRFPSSPACFSYQPARKALMLDPIEALRRQG